MPNWVYPSQQQYFNAMKVSGNSLIVLTAHQRKGFNPEERDVEIILAIHNVVNEKGEAVGFARSAHLVSSRLATDQGVGGVQWMVQCPHLSLSTSPPSL
jgi:hypothetical protein